MSKAQKLLIGTSVVCIVIVGGYVWYTTHCGVGDTTTTTTLPSGESVTVTGPGSVTITPVTSGASGKGSNIPAPDLHTLPVIPDSFSSDAKAAFEKEFADVQKALSSNAKDSAALIKLGSLRKIAGDYPGAEADWLYVSQLYPTEVTPYDNLGDLYQNFLKEYPKAEADYQKAIQIRPDDLNAYHALYSLYTDYGYKSDTNAAELILKQGIKNNPKAYDLYVLLARYYTAKHDLTDARAQYDLAISAASSTGQTSIADQISAEKSALH